MAGDFLLELADTLAQLRLLAGARRCGASSNSLLLGVHDLADFGIGGGGFEQRSSGNSISAAPSRSASRRALRAFSSFKPLVTIARLARVTVSSSRTTMSPILTLSPSRTRTSPTMPPVGCCTFLTLESTTICPGAISAPESCVVPAQPPKPITSTPTTTRPARICRRIEGCAADFWLMREPHRSRVQSCSGARAGTGRCSTLDRTASFGPTGCCMRPCAHDAA